MTVSLYHGDCKAVLKSLSANSVNSIITSPPYWGLRNYDTTGQLGLESTPEEYTQNLVAVFREARRVLRDDGTLWLNLGDCYAGGCYTGNNDKNVKTRGRSNMTKNAKATWNGLPSKSLIGIPWRVAFALQADGWILRSDIIWHKPNPTPESIRDRPTRAHEYIFLFSKSPVGYYDLATFFRTVTQAACCIIS